MPVEIRELILRATIINSTAQNSKDYPVQSQEEIIATCTEQVLQILKRNRER